MSTGSLDCRRSSSRRIFACSFQGGNSEPKEYRSRTRLGSDHATPVMARSRIAALSSTRTLMLFRSRQRGRNDQQHVGSVLALSDTRRYPNLGPAGDYHLIRVNLWWRGEIGLFSSRPHQYL